MDQLQNGQLVNISFFICISITIISIVFISVYFSTDNVDTRAKLDSVRDAGYPPGNTNALGEPIEYDHQNDDGDGLNGRLKKLEEDFMSMEGTLAYVKDSHNLVKKDVSAIKGDIDIVKEVLPIDEYRESRDGTQESSLGADDDQIMDDELNNTAIPQQSMEGAVAWGGMPGQLDEKLEDEKMQPLPPRTIKFQLRDHKPETTPTTEAHV